MIKEDIEGVTTRSIVTRVCDHCAGEDKISLGQILYSKNRKKLGKDYCKKCSYKYRVINHKKGSDSPFWTNGISLNPTSGYLRINKTKEYLHKKLYGDFAGRKITRIEQIHHIDMIKLNNDIENLFLCEDIKKHNSVHYGMEKLGYELLEKFIWFNRDSNRYTIKPYNSEKISFSTDKKPSHIETWKNGKRYEFVYISYRKHQSYHRYILEKYFNRKLKRNEHVHHIDGETLNNNINNLVVDDRSGHKKIHNSLQKCVAELYRNDVVKFKEGVYYV
jgi:hypothetical protein